MAYSVSPGIKMKCGNSSQIWHSQVNVSADWSNDRDLSSPHYDRFNPASLNESIMLEIRLIHWILEANCLESERIMDPKCFTCTNKRVITRTWGSSLIAMEFSYGHIRFLKCASLRLLSSMRLMTHSLASITLTPWLFHRSHKLPRELIRVFGICLLY